MINQPDCLSHTKVNGSLVADEQHTTWCNDETAMALQREIAERKRLEEALSVQRDLALALSSTSDLSTSLSYVLDVTLQLDRIDCGGIYLVNRNNGSLTLMVYRGLSEQFAKHIHYYDADTYQARMVRAGKPRYLHASAMKEKSSVLRELEGLRAIAILPICYEGHTLAVLNLGSLTYDELSASTRTILESIAAQVGGGIARIEAEEAYRNLVEHSLQGLIIYQDERIVFANPAMSAINGYTVQEMLGFSTNAIQHLVHPDDQAMVSTYLHKRRADANVPSRYEYRIVRKDCQIRWLEAYGVTTTYRGKPASQGTYIDITNRKQTEEMLNKTHDELEMRVQERTVKLIAINKTLQAEINERKRSDQALIESEKRYRTLVETSPSAILLTAMDRSIQFCNQQAAALFGYTSVDELCGKHGTDLVVLDNLIHDPLTHVQQILGAGNLRNIEYTMRRSDGSHFPAQVSSSIVTDTNNRPTAMIIIVQDISERKLTEKALATAYDDQTLLNAHLTHSRNLLRVIFDRLDDGLMLLDHTGTIQTINRTFATLLGRPVEALVNTTWDKEHRLTATLTTCLANLNTRQRIRYQYPDDAIRIFDIQALDLDTEEQQPMEQIIVHIADVTETVQLQARVLENERFAASGRLAASVAHEINTPLQGLQTALRMANVSSEKDRTYFLDHAREEIQRVGRIVNQLLDLYRTGVATYGVIHISTLIERILLLIGKRVREQKVIIEQNLTDVPPIWGRTDELTQVLLNIIVNALDVMPDGGTLNISCKQPNKHPSEHIAQNSLTPTTHPHMVCIVIADTGTGICTDIQDHIFEPFFTTKENGTGLGLAISTQIVQQYGGTIQVHNNTSVGSTFCIHLPVHSHATCYSDS